MPRFLLFVAIGLWISPAQNPRPAGAIIGRAIDDTTKEGIRRATIVATEDRVQGAQGGVAAFSPPTMYSATTDDNGHYRFVNLAPGKYRLRAEKAGYQGRMGTDAAVTVKPGEEASAAALVLIRMAAISGRVVDRDGDPVEFAEVFTLPVRRSRNSQPRGQATTNDRGEYRIPRLMAGSYILQVNKRTTGYVAPSVAPGEPVEVDATTYFPSVLDPAAAAPIRVSAGEERTGIDIRLQKSPAVRVAGLVRGIEGAASPASILLQPAGNNRYWSRFANWHGNAGPDGRFVLQSVTPGDYIAIASLHRAPAAMSHGFARLRVGQTNIDDLEISVHPALRLSGKAVAEGGAKLPPTGFNLSLTPVDPGIPGGGGAPIKPDGTFQFDNLTRAHLRLQCTAPRGWYLKSITVGGQRQPNLEIDLSSGEIPLELLFSNRPGAISVTAEGPVESPGRIMAIALEDDGNGAPALTNLYKAVPLPSGQTAVKIEDVPPGKYHVVLTTPELVDALADPSVWARLQSKAATVKVEESATVPASPRLIVETDVEAN